MTEAITAWISKVSPWTRYVLKREISGSEADDPSMESAYQTMRSHPLVDSLINELENWPGPVVKRHNDAKLLYHKLVFLTELGLTVKEPALSKVADKILAQQSPDGPFQILSNIPTIFGGSGKDEPLWMLCDAPLVTYAMVKLGLGEEPRVKQSLSYLVSLLQDFGWPCAAASKLGSKFKGPGKRIHPCPYANLIMLRMLSALPDWRNSNEARIGTGMMLDFWEKRKEIKYYLFGMGTDFRKLKAPFIWYDILHVTEVLTRFDFLGGDPRLKEMVEIIESRKDPEGLFKAESVYLSWKEWDFGQKREPSAWITLKSYTILDRWNKITHHEEST